MEKEKVLTECPGHNQNEKDGILYGIGVGPGDPELLTLKAVRLIRSCDVIFAPEENVRDSIAFQIASQAVSGLEEKICCGAAVPMLHDRSLAKQVYDQTADRIVAYLKEGKTVGFLNLGDVTLYSTYLHIHRRILAKGYRAELISGIPSFCAAAAAFHIGLAEGHEQFHILAKPNQVEEGIALPGTKVIMKGGRQLGNMKASLEASGQQVFLAENCTMPKQRLLRGAEAITGEEGYYSLLIVKEQKNEEETQCTGFTQ